MRDLFADRRAEQPEWRKAASLIGSRYVVGATNAGTMQASSPLCKSRIVPLSREEVIAESAAETRDIVYAVQQDGPPWAIKIGLTRPERLWTRMSALSSGSPYPVVLLQAWPGSNGLESYLHEEFAALRMNGEWFYPEERLVRLLGRGKYCPPRAMTMEYCGPGSELLSSPIVISPEDLDEDVERAVARSHALAKRVGRLRRAA